jgi:hypothetical protein
MGEHARLSPSNHRWPHCPGSIREEANYPDTSNPASIDGTGSHLLLEMCLEHETDAKSFINETIGVDHEDKPEGWLVKQDRCDRVQVCLDYVSRRKKELGDDHPECEINIDSESRSNPGGVLSSRDDWWGTVDISIKVLNNEGHLLFIEVIDFKDGRTFVSEKDNSQLIAYIYGKLTENMAAFCNNFRMTIVQPKTTPSVRYFNVNNQDDMYIKYITLLKAAELTDDPEAPLVPDTKNGKGYCRWCKHKDNCEARKDQLKEGFDMDIFGNVGDMSSDDLGKLIDKEASVLDIFKNAKLEVERRIGDGKTVPGYAMKPGSSKKAWNIDDDELYKILIAKKLKRDEIYIPKLISPAQALKHESLSDRQKESLEQHISLKPGEVKLKAVSREVQQTAVDMFSDVVIQCNTEIPSFL